MEYKQKVKIKNIDFEIVSKAFHSIDLVVFLTSFQPVKIVNWSGIESGVIAYFKLWFFGWKDFKVKHEEYKLSNKKLFFIDTGLKLPFGISFWKHIHIVEHHGKNTIIKDIVSYSHPNNFIGFLLFPMLMFPIIIRRLLYRLYFLKNSH